MFADTLFLENPDDSDSRQRMVKLYLHFVISRERFVFLLRVVNRGNFVWSEWSKWNEFVWSELWL